MGLALSGQATAIATGTGGALVSSKVQKTLVDNIKDLLENIERRYYVDQSECSQYIDSEHTTPLPIDLNPNQAQTVVNTMKLKERICDTV